jgi:simple sugar transport system substrate-binding protein
MLMRKTILPLLLILTLALILSACGAQPTPTPEPVQEAATPTPLLETQPTEEGVCQDEATGSGEMRPWRFVVISHGDPASSKFWSVVKEGVDAAAHDMRVEVEYWAPTSFDLEAMAQKIRETAASKPDGMVVSIPDMDTLRGPIEEAIAAGVPVITFNSGSGVAEQLDVLAHVGQTEYTAGYAAGEQLANAGVKKGLCLIQEAGNTALEVRCQGFEDAMNVAGGEVISLVVEDVDGEQAKALIGEAMDKDPAINGILALGSSVGEPALAWLRASGRTDTVWLASFDLSPEMLEAVQSGEMLFLVDQQPYLQGYLPIMYLTQYQVNLSRPATKIILTGPTLVTREDAAHVLELSQQGLR